MNLKLVRKTFTEESPIGVLWVNGKTECFTLEDRVRAAKVPGGGGYRWVHPGGH